jgi:hypothetical protein
MKSKMRKLMAGATILVSILLMSTVSVPQTLDDVPSFRCDGEIIAIGDRQYAVRQACGDPEKITFSGGGTVEEWVYNFGPNTFIYYVTFVHKRLERIQTGEYGFEE